MKLSVLERIVLSGLLPKETSHVAVKMKRELREALSFDDKELKALQIKIDEAGNMTWSKEGADKIGNKEIKVPDYLSTEIKAILTKLDKEKKLTEQLDLLYEKFIEGDK